jgi:hypothetical protein
MQVLDQLLRPQDPPFVRFLVQVLERKVDQGAGEGLDTYLLFDLDLIDVSESIPARALLEAAQAGVGVGRIGANVDLPLIIGVNRLRVAET